MRLVLWALMVAASLALATACGTETQEATTTPTRLVVPAVTADPTRNPTATIAPTSTPTQLPEPTVTAMSLVSLPDGWQRYGNERFGLQVAAPQSWVDLTALLRTSAAISRLGPRLLFVTDSDEGGRGLLAGALPEQVAFVFGFRATTDGSLAQASEPVEALGQYLAGLGTVDLAEVQPNSIRLNGLPGAYVNLDHDPLRLFPVSPSIRTRLFLVVEPESGEQAIFMMGASAASWDNHQDEFDDIVELIRLTEGAANIPGHLTSGESVERALEAEMVDLWSFNGEGKRYATITLIPADSSIDLTLALIDPAGLVLEDTDAGLAGDPEVLADVLLPENGTFLVEVGEFFNEAGPYELSLQLFDEPQFSGGGYIDRGQEVTAELLENGEHNWAFIGTAGQKITVVLSSLDEQLDVILELRGPDGRELVLLDEGFAGDAEILTGFELPVTGEYLIFIRGFAGHGGVYGLSLDEGGEETANFFDAGDLVYGQSMRELVRPDEAHAWFFNGIEGDEVTIEVTPLEANMDMDIWLLSPDLDQIAMKDEFLSGESEKIEETLPLDGQYLILVREFFGESGEYEITLDVSGDNVLEVAGAIEYGQTTSGELSSGVREGWTFMGRVDDIVDITLTPAELEHDLVIVLVDPSGTVAITVDAALSGSTERLIAYRLPYAGEWMILVREFFDEGGPYELTLTRQE